MELKVNSWDIITTPEDCKEVIKDNVITVEKEKQEFKDGDFCISSRDGRYFWVYIHKSGAKNHLFPFFYAFTNNESTILYYDGRCSVVEEMNKLATEEEKQILLDAMHADGKDWDADNKKIIEYRCKPNYRELYYNINYSLDIQIDSHVWYGDALDEICFSNGNCFKTIEEAQKYADKFSEILKGRKL